jgi:hypothetical protein
MQKRTQSYSRRNASPGKGEADRSKAADAGEARLVDFERSSKLRSAPGTTFSCCIAQIRDSYGSTADVPPAQRGLRSGGL